MKKFLCIIMLLSSATYIAKAQSSVAIGDSSPKASAVLYLKGNGSQGLIIPIVSNTTSIATPESGMIVYNSTDHQVYFYKGSSTTWLPLGTGTGGGNTYTLSLSGNNLLLRDATTTVSTVPIAASAPTAANQFLTWDGAKWVATAFSQDAANVNGAITVNGIKGKAIPALPSTTQALVYNGTAWVFQPLTGGTDSQDLTLNATTNSLILTNDATPVDLTPYKQTLTIAGSSLSISGGNSVTIPGATYTGGTGITVAGTVITNTGDTNATDDLTTTSTAAGDVTGLFSNLQLASGVVSSTEIADGTIAAADLSSMSASSGQILKYNGTAWVPAPDDAGVGATPTLSNGQILIGNGTSNSASALSGDAALAGSALTISNSAITSAKIADGAIVAADLNAMSATNGQVLKFNGTNWAPAAEAGTTYTGGTGISVAGTVISNTGDTNAADDLTTASTAAGDVTGLFSNLQLASGVVSSTEIADGSIVAADLNAMSATNGQVLKFNGTNWAPAVEAGTTYTGGTGISVAGTVISNTGDTNAADDLTTASTAAGDVTGLFSNLQLASGVVSSTEIADGTIAAADLSSMSASNGQILKFNGSAWVPSPDDVGGGATPTLSSGQILIGDGSSNSAVALTGDATLVGGVMTISGNAITSAEITDGAIVAGDLNAMSATNGQVLKFNGTNWAPAAEAGATYTGGTGISVVGTVISNTGDPNAADDLTTASTAAGDVTGLFSNLQLASGVVSSTEIADGTIVAADLNAMSATNGQVLKFNGTNWAPAAEAGATYTGGTGISVVGTVISNTGDPNAADDLTTASTAAGDVTGLFSNLQIASGAVTTTEIADGTVTAVDLNSMSATTGQVLQYNGTNWAPSPGGLTNPMNANGDLIVGGAGGTPNKLASVGGFLRSSGAAATPAWSSVGLATTDVAGVLPVANGGTGGTTWNGLLLGSGATIGDISTGTSGQILRVAGTTPTWSNFAIISADITDGTIMDADVNTAAGIAGSKVNPAFAAQNISTTGTATVGGGITAGGASQFTINGTGNVTRINNVVTSFPAAQGAANTVLINDGAGTLTWATAPSPFSTNNIVPRGNGTTLVASTIQDNGTTTGIGVAPVATNKLTVTNSTAGVLQAILATNSQVGAGSSFAVKGDASGSTSTNFGLHGTATGGGSGASGVFGTASGSVSTQGVYGIATGTGVTTAYGVRGSATSTSATNNYGVYGDASGGTNNWAGFFSGNVTVTGGLSVGATTSYGTSGQILTSAGAGVAPTWTNPSGTTLITNSGFENLFAGFGTNTAGGNDNAFFGFNSGKATTGPFNTFVGAKSGLVNSTGTYNTYIGGEAGVVADVASYNVFVGASSGFEMLSGNLNTFVGFEAGKNDHVLANPSNGGDGISNTYIGNKAGKAGASVNYNTFLGERAGENTGGIGIQEPSASENTFVGRVTGATNTTGLQNTLLGANANVGGAALQNATAIGYRAYVTANNSLVLGSINGVNSATANTNVGIGTTAPTTEFHVTHGNGSPAAGNGLTIQNVGAGNNNFALFVSNATGNLNLFDNTTFVGGFAQVSGTYTPVSDRRFKKNIVTIEEVLPKLSEINIRRYHFKKQDDNDPTNIGVIAQELKEIYPELVHYSPESDRYTVDYQSMGPLAIKAIQEQQQMIEKLLARINGLESSLVVEKAEKVELKAQLDQLSSDVEQIRQSLGLDKERERIDIYS